MTRVSLTYSKFFWRPRLSSTSLRIPPTYSSLVRILAIMTGSSTLSISAGSGERDLVADAGRGGDEIEVVLALEALLNNFEMEQTEEAATEAEAEGYGGL